MADRDKMLEDAEEAVRMARQWLWKAELAHQVSGDLQERGVMVGACADTADSWLRVAEWYRDETAKLPKPAPAPPRPAPVDS